MPSFQTSEREVAALGCEVNNHIENNLSDCKK